MTFAIPRASNAFEACLNWVSRINVYYPTRLKLSALRSPSCPRKQSPLLLLSLPFFKDKPQRNDPDAVAEEKALPDLYTKLWDAVTSQRLLVSSARDRLQESRVLLQLSVNLASSAADVAFVADAEFVA